MASHGRWIKPVRGLNISKKSAKVNLAFKTGVQNRRVTRERLNAILAKHTGQPLDRLEKDTDRDYFMSGEEAVAYGLIDTVLERRGAVDLLAPRGS